MTTAATHRGAPEWTSTPARLGVEWDGPVLVAGDRAAAVAAAYRAAGAPPLVGERPGISLLASEDLSLPDDASPGATGLPDASIAVVSLRSAWHSGATLDAATEEAFRILRPGGRLLLADLAATEMLTRPPHNYPASLVYRQLPGAAAVLGSGVHHIDLPVRVMSARFSGVSTEDIDETLGSFATPAEFVAHLQTDASDRLAGYERDAVESALEATPAVLRRLVPRGEIVDREPWRVVAAVKPG